MATAGGSTALICCIMQALRIGPAVAHEADYATNVVARENAVKARNQRCDIAMPQGNSPTWIDLTTLRLATSMTDTSFETPLVVSRYFSSGVKAMCQTRCP